LFDHTLYGKSPGGYHLTNVVLHAVNAVLVLLLVTRLTGHGSIGLVTAVLFAVHPVQIETVAWVSSRKTLLCSVFMLASGLCWLRPDRTGRQELHGSIWLALALLTKAAAIVLPPIVLAYDVLVRRKTIAEALPRQLAPGFLCILLLNITMSAQTSVMGGVRGHLGMSKLQIVGIDSVIVWKYVGMLVWPAGLSVLYDPPTQGILLPIVLSTIAWIAVGLICWKTWRRWPLVTLAVATWFLLLFPVLNFFPITTLMNDRYLYLPCVCAFALVGGALDQLRHWIVARQFGRLKERQWVFSVVSGVIVSTSILGYTGATMSYLPAWRNGLTLWAHTVNHVPQLPVVQIQWADALYDSGHHERAIEVLEETLQSRQPDEADRRRIEEKLIGWRQRDHA
ncbi:MAG: glycosyltransferase family 39 protein, partial [Planctomycetaceae bacterium]|nr:glycosyltransferase family 39 protein [Planctomycetaceae bacterium]